MKSKISPELFDYPVAPITNNSRYKSIFDQTSAGRRAVLGIGALTHDTSAALVSSETGDVIYAISEERLSNCKHDSRFPIGAIVRCCEKALASGLIIQQIAVNFDPNLFFPNLISSELSTLGVVYEKANSFLSALATLVRKGIPLDIENPNCTTADVVCHIKMLKLTSIDLEKQLLRRLSWYFNVAVKYHKLAVHIRHLFSEMNIQFIAHHRCHAANALFGSGFHNTSILVIDGHGETDTTTIYKAQGDVMECVATSKWPNSLGAIYLAVTRYLGFDYGDEYKVMGMSAYGKPQYLEQLAAAVTCSVDGTVQTQETNYFGIGEVNTSGQLRFEFRSTFQSLCSPRQPENDILQEHFDLAASVQSLIENIGVDLARKARELTGSEFIAIAGGVGLNGLMNEAIRKYSGNKDVFIYPAASDDGTSAGAAMSVLLDRGIRPNYRIHSCYYGNLASDEEIKSTLRDLKINYTKPSSINRVIAAALGNGKIVARFYGAAEYGPRALGNRSILASPAIPEMKDILNLRVKHREQFRPFAPACMREHVNTYFDFDDDAPFMITIVKARELTKHVAPSVVHNDGTSRVQTVTAIDSPDFYQTLSEFFEISKVPILINTSFNVNGEAIVDTPLDAIESFLFMDIDFLAIGDYWVSKVDNVSSTSELTHNEYLAIRTNRYYSHQLSPLIHLDVRKYEQWFYPSSEKLDAILNEF